MHAYGHACEGVWECVHVFYECRSSLFVIDGLVPYLSLRDPVLVCWHPLFTSCLQQTHVVRAVRKGRKRVKESQRRRVDCMSSCQQDLTVLDHSAQSHFWHLYTIERRKELFSSFYFWFYFLLAAEILCLVLTGDFSSSLSGSTEQLPGQCHIFSRRSAEG